MFKTLQSYVPSFAALIIFAALYTALVFLGADQSQNFKVAKKLNAEKASTEMVEPLRAVASPLDTE